MHVLIEEATHAQKAITLGVVKINPARRLYERLGFRVTHEDQHKVYMRREPGPKAQERPSQPGSDLPVPRQPGPR